MKKSKLGGIGAIIAVIIIGLVVALNPILESNSATYNLSDFPDFYTKTEDYYITRIGPVPNIDEDSYKLSVTGFVDNPTNFNLSELRALPLISFPLTIECIGNPSLGSLLSTANWTGFSIYDLINSLGLNNNATGVKYYAADGYYATHTMEQLIDNTVIGALYLNNLTLPPIQGFPLRIINPGYYGAKQPAWVTDIEVIDMPLKDYWDDRGWDTSPSMPVDSNIFFPVDGKNVQKDESVSIGGAAYGGTRISKVEYTLNNGDDWYQAEIIKSVNVDNVWVFWHINLSFSETGPKSFYVRATDIFGRTQPLWDLNRKDGHNSWPHLSIQVV
jgi:hypothetical protein